MSDDITLPGSGSVVETLQQPGGEQRQVVAVSGESLQVLQTIAFAVEQLVKTMGQSMPDVAGRLRVSLDATSGTLTISTVSTVTTVTTVNTVTNQAQVGGFTANHQIPALMMIPVMNHRNQISVT